MPEPDAAQSQPRPPRTDTAQLDLFDQALINLVPFFMDGAEGDPARARSAVLELLRSYAPRSAVELQLITETIAFSHSALDNLRRAQTNRTMPDVQREALRTKAVSLSAAGHRATRTLDRMYAGGRPQAAPHPGAAKAPEANAGRDQAAILRAVHERMAQQRAQTAAQQQAAGDPGAFMNREQRRAAELDARRDARRAAG
nr:hypothetical protein [uncultured Rhodopila sp.]